MLNEINQAQKDKCCMFLSYTEPRQKVLVIVIIIIIIIIYECRRETRGNIRRDR
jgi:hypothetical protein